MGCKNCGKTCDRTYCCRRCCWTWNNHNRTLTPNEVGPCAICGDAISRWVSPARRRSAHDPRLFCGRTCAGAGRTGENHPAWKGGVQTDKDGYVLVYSPDHPFATASGYVRKHRLVMEKKIGRYLTRREVVHHKNDDPSDNRMRNLVLYPSNADHKRDDSAKRNRDANGRLTTKEKKCRKQ